MSAWRTTHSTPFLRLSLRFMQLDLCLSEKEMRVIQIHIGGKKNHLIFKDGNHEKMGREAKAIIDRLDWLSEGVNEPRSTVRGRRGQREREGRRLSLMRTEQVVREKSEAQGAGCPLAGRRGAFLLREPFTQY